MALNLEETSRIGVKTNTNKIKPSVARSRTTNAPNNLYDLIPLDTLTALSLTALL